MRTKRKIVFIPNVVSPICLPTPQDHKMAAEAHNPIAFVAGWGANYMNCDSNDFGPAPNTMCRFPFVSNGRKANFCSMRPTPSAANPVCKTFYQWSKRSGNPIKLGYSDSVKINYWDSALNGSKVAQVQCYRPDPGRRGWCGTCYQGNVQPGQEGYCDLYGPQTLTKLQREFSRPTTDSNWGWCANWCKPGMRQASSNHLMETDLTILEEHVCDKLGQEIALNSTVELCGGKKKQFPLVRIYKRLQGKNGRYQFKQDGVVRDRLGISSEFDFYLGGQDSCQGEHTYIFTVILPFPHPNVFFEVTAADPSSRIYRSIGS